MSAIAANERNGQMAMAIDPVCGMEVDTTQPAATSDYQGTTYYFCAPGCKRQFDRDPGKYLDQQSAHAHDHEHDAD